MKVNKNPFCVPHSFCFRSFLMGSFEFSFVGVCLLVCGVVAIIYTVVAIYYASQQADTSTHVWVVVFNRTSIPIKILMVDTKRLDEIVFVGSLHVTVRDCILRDFGCLGPFYLKSLDTKDVVVDRVVVND